jgi:uncharacterized membrane protein
MMDLIADKSADIGSGKLLVFFIVWTDRSEGDMLEPSYIKKFPNV